MIEAKDSEPFGDDEQDFDTILANDISFSGEINFSKPFMIKGRVSGTIDATSDLLIDTNAEVNANITTDRIVVRGKVKGNIVGRRLVYVTATGSVEGDITTPQVVLELGASFSGKCTMSERTTGK